MKITLCVLVTIILDIFITYAACQDEALMHDRIITKPYPKKLKKLQILNPTKFLKLRSNEYKKRYLEKHNVRKKSYTFFPEIANQSKQGIPDSPFFQLEQDIEPKVRVKKVLPDYILTLSRGKRSVKGDDIGGSKDTIQGKKKNKRRTKKDNDDKTLKSKAKINSTGENTKAKRKRKSKNVAKSTIQLKYTVKGSMKSRGRSLRKGKRSEKQNLREKRIQHRHKNIDNLRRKKERRQEEKDSRRLIAGKDAMIADYPYVVSIQKGGEHWCAGALLNQRLVITTANCIWKSDHISRLRIRAGARHADRGGQLAKIQEVMKHPKWSIRSNPDNDVALILLDRNIKFSDKVHSVDLPNHAMMPAFDDAWVTSWGAERRDGIFENTQFTLQVYHSRLMDHAKCNNVTQRFGVRVSENFICLTQTGRRAPCTRDTGAPAVSDGILWGLASWGIRKLCGTERFPAMFSYLASPSNLGFITNATHSLMSEHRFYPFPDRFEVKRTETTTASVVPDIDYM